MCFRFLYDLISYNWPNGGATLPQQLRCYVMYRLTPLVLIASRRRRRQVPRLDESFEQGVPWTYYTMHRYLTCNLLYPKMIPPSHCCGSKSATGAFRYPPSVDVDAFVDITVATVAIVDRHAIIVALLLAQHALRPSICPSVRPSACLSVTFLARDVI